MTTPARVGRGRLTRTSHEYGVMMLHLGVACIVVTLSLSQALAISPGEMFRKFVERKSLEECLAEPDNSCVFKLTVAAAEQSQDENKKLRDVARMQASSGFLDRARSATSRIHNSSHWYPAALSDIVVEQARAGRVKEALVTAEAVRRAGADILSNYPGTPETLNPLWYVRSLCAIASAQARSGDENAKKNLTKAITIAKMGNFYRDLRWMFHREGLNLHEIYETARAWHYIVEAHLHVEGLDGAQRALKSMRSADPSARWVILTLNNLAMAQASAALDSQALETFAEARRLAVRMDGATAPIFYLSRVAVAQAKAGYVSAARTSFRKAVEMAKKVDGRNNSIKVLSDVSQAQRDVGLHDDADTTANIAVEAAHGIVDELRTEIPAKPVSPFFVKEFAGRMAKALRVLASAQIQASRIEEAEKTVDRIQNLIASVSHSHYTGAMAELAIAQWSAGRKSDAVATIDAAQKRANAYRTEWYKIAVAKATVGNVRGALRIGVQSTGDTRFQIFQSVAELILER